MNAIGRKGLVPFFFPGGPALRNLNPLSPKVFVPARIIVIFVSTRGSTMKAVLAMKKHFTSIITTMALVVIALCLSSCGKEEDTTPVVGGSPRRIEGEWKCTYSPFKSSPADLKLVFYKGDILKFLGYLDGDYNLTSEKQKDRRGNWQISGNIVTFDNSPTSQFELKWNSTDQFYFVFNYNGQEKNYQFKRMN